VPQLHVRDPSASSRSALSRFLAIVERGGNALPHPATLFAGMAALVIVVSAVAAALDISVTHPGTGALVRPVSLLSLAGLHRILTEMVSNFTGFAPLGTVLVAMLGIAVAEGSGLITAGLKVLVLSAPRRLLTMALVFAGVMSNTGGEVGYVLLVPLAAVIFAGVGRHPVAGLAAAFAGVSGGYSANLLLGTLDPLLAGLSEEAARIIDPAYIVNPTANYYFMVTSTFVITAAGTVVTEWIVEPRLGPWRDPGTSASAGPPHVATALAPAERRGLRWTGAAALALMAVLLWGTVPADGFLRDPASGSLLRSPFMSGMSRSSSLPARGSASSTESRPGRSATTATS
jgi:aminobenzoyl-glutamate transport protein